MSTNLNRHLRLGIRTKLLVAFHGLSTLPVLLLGLYAIHVHRASLELRALDGLRQQVTVVREQTAAFLHRVHSDLLLLQSDPALGDLLAAHSPDQVTRGFEDLAEVFTDFLGSQDDYYQIRCFTEAGQQLTVSRQLGALRASRAESPGARFYEYLVADLPPGRPVAAPAELHESTGALVAVISYTVRVRGAHGAQLVLVLDVFAEELFRNLELAHQASGVQVVLATGEGYYLYHSQRKTGWGQLLGSRQDHNVRRDYPPELAARLLAGRSGMEETGSEVLAFAPLMPQQAPRGEAYTLIIGASQEDILAPVVRFERVFQGLLVVIVAISIGLATAAAAHFTRPIAALERGARVVAAGAFGQRLQVETFDEIQSFAETFNAMAAAVQQREGALRRHEAQLQETVAARTRELARQKSTLQAILDSVPSAFVVLDGQLRILSASSAFERLTGRSPTTVIGQPYAGIFADTEPPAARALIQGRIVSCIHDLSTPGQRRYLERLAIPISTASEVGRVIEVVTDVTERKEMEDRVIQAGKLATTGEMAAVIAHELRNSLTSVRMILQLELSREDRQPADRDAMQVALRAVEDMGTLVADLLRYARPAPLRLQPLAVDGALEEAVALVRHQYRGKSVQLECDCRSAGALITGDREQLKEVFVNLLLNAAAAAPRGGHVTTASQQAADYVMVTVADDGPGIPPEHLERIFDPFFTTRLDGTGLGLSMARRTTEAHGGRIEARNRPPGGALFEVRLPLADTATDPAA